MNDIKYRFVQTNGITMHVAEQGEGPLVLLVHGFPESWYSWKKQMSALAAAGYRVVAMDQRGYGQTDKPTEIEDYNIFKLTGDLIGLVGALGEKKAIIVGHDWGSPVAWHAAQFRPDIFRAVALMSVPFFVARDFSDVPPTHLMTALGSDDEIFYQLFFQKPGAAEAAFEADYRFTLSSIFHGISGAATTAEQRATIYFPAKPPVESSAQVVKEIDWLSKEDLDFYVAELKQSGFRGPLNWYRNIDFNWGNTGFLSGSKLLQPTLFIAGEYDPVLEMYPGTYESLEERVPDLWQKTLLPDVGHWVQQEAAEEVNCLLLEFFESLAP